MQQRIIQAGLAINLEEESFLLEINNFEIIRGISLYNISIYFFLKIMFNIYIRLILMNTESVGKNSVCYKTCW